MVNNGIDIYHGSLRNGSQMGDGAPPTVDKLAITEAHDGLRTDYIESGQPGSSAVDDALFSATPKYTHARLAALSRLQTLGGRATSDSSLTWAQVGVARVVSLAGTASECQACGHGALHDGIAYKFLLDDLKHRVEGA